MTADLRQLLQSSLGSAYRLERELGGGGMSRTYVAQEAALDRKVVVKILSPELAAGVSIDRFRREIQLAATLQHPHVVPVLASGDADGLPWFTMPYVEGESLRARLARSPLSLDEVTGILRDVARALEFAHARGVVHRDIKPDNVLLAGSSATVTDFGIAKAISASRTVDAGATLTVAGTAMGTPAYMAPEQAAGDPTVDHRADIYAFGAMAYELLTGRPPFVGGSSARVIAAHFSEVPQEVRELRPDTPAALANLIMCCLSKLPADRPATTSVLVQTLAVVSTDGAMQPPAILRGGQMHLGRALALWAVATAAVILTAWAATRTIGLPDWGLPGAIGVMLAGLPAVLGTWYVQRATHRALVATPTLTPGGSRASSGTMSTIAMRASPHVSWRRTWAGGAFAVGGFALLVVGVMVLRAFGIGPLGSLRGAGQFSDRETILVADFKSPAGDPLLGATIAEAVRTDLAQSANLKVISRSATSDVLRMMGRNAEGAVEFELAREIATREGAKAVLDGNISRLGPSYVVSARLVSSLDGSEMALFRRTADGDDDLIGAIGKLSRDIRGKVGESLRQLRDAQSLERVTTSSLPALRKYVEAGQAISAQGEPEIGRRLLREALDYDSTFAMAWRRLASTYAGGSRQFRKERLLAISNAYRFRDRLSENERLLTEASYFSFGPNPDRDRAIAAYEALIARDSQNSAALNNASTRLFSAWNYTRAAFLLERAVALPQPFGGAFINLVDTYVAQGDIPAAKRTLQTFRQRLPEHVDHWIPESAILIAERQVDSAAQLSKVMLAGAPAGRRREMAGYIIGNIAMMQGRVRDALAGLAASEQPTAGAARSPAVQLRASLDTAIVVAHLASDTLRAREVVRRALIRIPLESLDPVDRPLDELALAARLMRDGVTARLAFSKWTQDTAVTGGTPAGARAFQMQIALAEGRYPEAIDHLREMTQRREAPERYVAAELGNTFDLSGQADSAIVYYERFLERPLSDIMVDAPFLAGVHKRLAELYDARGDANRAVTNYLRFAELWANADPELQPAARRARARAAELSRGRG